MRRFASLVLLAAVWRNAVALDNGLALTPQMGWNTWNHFGCSISEDTIMSAANAIIANNLTQFGYECKICLVSISATWSNYFAPHADVIMDDCACSFTIPFPGRLTAKWEIHRLARCAARRYHRCPSRRSRQVPERHQRSLGQDPRLGPEGNPYRTIIFRKAEPRPSLAFTATPASIPAAVALDRLATRRSTRRHTQSGESII